MKYLRVHWKHHHPEEPVVLYSELDARRFEVRKVEVFRDDRYGYASAEVAAGGTALGIVETPELQQIAMDPQFDPSEISRAEFEEVWRRATQV